MMVWGMTLPENFGEFWPEGRLEKDNWAERVRAYHWSLPPEEKTALYEPLEGLGGYAYYVAGKFKNEMGSRVSASDPPLTAIREHEVPRSYDTRKSYQTLGSLISLESMILAVDETLKATIERLEPGRHQFYPLEIRMPKGKIFPNQFYTLVIGQYFDAFSPDESQIGSFRRTSSGLIRLYSSKAELNGLAMRRAAFGNAHLWRDRYLETDLTCFSDELHGEIKKAGLLMPRHFYQLKEV